jgi:hypothetical protein
MAPREGDRILCRYAVAFDAGEVPAAGSLVVTDDSVWLSGRSHGEPIELIIPRDQVTRIRIGRGSEERLNGYSTVVLERRDGTDVLVAPFGFGHLHEIAELLGSISDQPRRPSARLELIVPIRKGSQDRVRRLVASGPPFHPVELGLRRHDVYLDEEQVRFVFEGDDVRAALQQLLGDPALWRAGLSWRRHIVGRPYLRNAAEPEDARSGELVYSWHR